MTDAPGGSRSSRYGTCVTLGLAREHLVVAIRDRVKGTRPSVLRLHVMYNLEELYTERGSGQVASR